MNEEPALKTPSKFKERLKWIAPILLAMMVVCVGCFFFLAAGLVARGELTTGVLGTNLRLWAITERQQTGVGLQRSFEFQRAAQTCTHFDVTLLLWRPNLSIENHGYDNCE
jgi:hypothetical protein